VLGQLGSVDRQYFAPWPWQTGELMNN